MIQHLSATMIANVKSKYRSRLNATMLSFWLVALSVVLGKASGATEDEEIFQEQTLLKLFAGTGGFKWRNRNNWNGEKSVCEWYGITCYDDDDETRSGLIRGIELEDNKLVGTPPQDIFDLPYLESIVLKTNPDMSFSFDNIGQATSLKTLKLSGNDLTSVDGIGNALSLEYLHLTENDLTGTIPDEIYRLTNLKGLFCNFNTFTGTISTKIRKLTNIEELYFYDNNLSGELPTELGLLTKMKTLSLAQNSFSGVLPETLNNLVNIEILAIQREDTKKTEGLTGSLPSFDKLQHLEELYLAHNSLSGPIPANFLSGIKNRGDKIRIDLSHNKLSGPVPISLLSLPRVTFLLPNNKIDELPADFCEESQMMGGDVGNFGCDAILCKKGYYSDAGRQTSDSSPCLLCDNFTPYFGSTECASSVFLPLTEQDILEKFYNELDGRFWKDAESNKWLDPNAPICEWKGITCVSEEGLSFVSEISLQSNELIGTVPMELYNLPYLTKLDLSGNMISIQFKNIASAKALTELNLSSTGLSLLSGLSEATSLTKLDVGNNLLGAASLNDIFQLTNLKELVLSHNDFNRAMPPEIGQLTNLRRLYCYGSGFHGQIPKEIGYLTQLLILDIAENDFTGNLPNELNRLTKAERISIHQVGKSGQGITGSLLTFEGLTHLRELYLDSNNLTGKLPPELLLYSEVLDEKIIIGLSNNQITGAIPLEYQRFTRLDIDLTNNKITEIPPELCLLDEWMNGWVATYRCDAILCPTEFYGEFGKQSADDYACIPCSDVGNGVSPYLGALKCQFDTVGGASLPERDILEKVFFLTGGRNWNNNENWMDDSTSYCNWHGITCDNGNVVSVNLGENGVSGSFPSDVYNLPLLNSLDLKGNTVKIDFNGIKNATNLKLLYLSETGISSLSGIEAATSLEVLHLTDNDLTGSFPTEILKLTKLRELYLNYNQLSGKVPSRINRLKELEELFLYQNRFSGQIPASIGELSNLRLLAIAVNDLSGTLPEELNDLTNLEILSLEGNNKRNGEGIGGPLLDFSGLTKLKELFLNSNSLEGTIPLTFLNGISDKFVPIKVDLVSNELTGTIPGTLGSFQKMKLYLANNKIESIDPDLCLKDGWNAGDVGNYSCDGLLCPPNTFNPYGRQNDFEACKSCPSPLTAPYFGSTVCFTNTAAQTEREEGILERFYVAMGGTNWKNNANWMDDSVSICEWYGITCVSSDEETVKAIHLSRNELEGKVPKGLFFLPNLVELDLSHNKLEMSFENIGNTEKLEYLNLDSTGITDLDGIEQAQNLNVLHLMSNKFSQGKIPDNIFTLKNLEVLYLSDNDFSGELPQALSTLINLKFFSCFACGLVGSIPIWMGDLSYLEYLRLDGNSFTGKLPGSLSKLQVLQHLDLSQQTLYGGEGLTGPLISFSECLRLTELFLFSNNISGEIPSTFLEKTDKTLPVEVDLRQNNIVGEIPGSLSEFSKLTIQLAGNKIDSLSTSICQSNSLWMHGDVSTFSCDGILCPPNTFNALGRQSSTDKPCLHCPAAKFYGSVSCGALVISDTADTSSERGILTHLYAVTRGGSWANSRDWLSTTVSICKWHGIQCDDNGNVKGIDLTNNGVTGAIPQEVFLLKSLENLVLKDNHVDFSFDGISKAHNLKKLVLSNTGLKSIKGVGDAPMLEILHITDNQIRGNIPKELFVVATLTQIYANFNRFSGPIPTAIGHLTGLTELFFYHNSLSGQLPTELGNLVNIEIMTFAENMFTGTLPTELNNLKNIKTLAIQREGDRNAHTDNVSITGNDVVDAGITGPLLDFSGLKRIQELYLGSNNLTGKISSEFLSGVSDKSKPIKVDITLNELTGSIPAELAAFSSMKFYAAGNKISGIADGICNLNDWMNGAVADFDCNAILCPPQTFNDYGRQPTKEFSCQTCGVNTNAPYWGSLECMAEDQSPTITEKAVLMKLYDATNGPSWEDNNNWGNENASICDWFGVKCSKGIDGSSSYVSKLYLNSNKLSGTVPSEIFQLPSLTILYLQDNPNLDIKFDGIAKARKLQELNVDATKINSFRGIGEASERLTFLSMQNNNFGGNPIPDELFNIEKLRYLNIANNKLAGPLPLKIGTMKYLEEFHCGGNDLSGKIPYSIGNLSKLKVLAMSENDFTGPLPEELGELRKLTSLFLNAYSRDDEGLSGPLLPFSSSPDLNIVYIASNSLTGPVPSSFLSGVDDTMQEVAVDLKSNLLSGTLPGALARFKRLEIDLAGNKLEGIHPDLCEKEDWMGGAVKLFKCDAILCPPDTFSLHGRQSTENAPCKECDATTAMPYWGSLECGSKDKVKEREILEKFYHECGGEKWKNSENWLDPGVDYCDWYGINCHENQYVNSILLGSNNVVGTPPAEIFQLPKLKWLWLYSNPVNFSFEGIGNAHELISLLLDSTSISSMEGVGEATSLIELDLRFNKLTGKIPDEELKKLVLLESLSLSDNNFQGTVPSSLVELTNLKKLRLGSNQLSGSLPDFASHSNLKSLDLSNNKLDGTIPVTLLQSVKPGKAVFIDLSSNQLTGAVPGSLARFDSLVIYLRDNKITTLNPDLCEKEEWMEGDVGDFDCDGLLCAPGTFSETGRQSKAGSPCRMCGKAEFYGSSTCESTTSKSSEESSGAGLLELDGYVIFFAFMSLCIFW